MNRKDRRAAAKRGLTVPRSGKAMEAVKSAWTLIDVARKCAESGQFGNAREAIGFARQLLERYPAAALSVQGLAVCDLQDGYLYWRFGALPQSKASLEKALFLFRDLKDDAHAASCELQLGVTLAAMGAANDAWDHIDSARRVFARLDLAIEVARAELTLAKLARAEHRTEEAERLLVAAITTFEAHNMALENGDALEALAGIYIADHCHLEAEPLLRKALRIYRSRGAESGIPFCESQLALVLRETARPDEALSLALSAINGFDAIRYALDNPVSRDAWAQRQHKAQSLAMEIASERGDARLVAEVIESARLQIVPAPDQSPSVHGAATQQEESGGVPVGLSVVSAQKLVQIRQVSVAGVSLLAVGDARNAIELMDFATEIGGPGSWWWGTLQVEGQLWWSLVRPDGVVESGSIGIAKGSTALEAVEEWYDALPLAESSEHIAEVVRAGSMSELSREKALSDRLGLALLPQSLREALISRSGDDGPLSLVVAPCGLLGRIPIAALGIGDGRRVLETAVVRMAPSIALMAALAQEAEQGRRGLGGPGPLHVGVFNPSAGVTLPQASRLERAAGAGIALSGKNATPDKLREALRTTIIKPGQAGLFVYAGHARQPTLGLSLICLHRADGRARSCPIGDCCGGDPVTIGDLLSTHADGSQRRYPMPGRVLLCGCDTSGAATVGAGGEWIGLAPAFLWAGARNVVATLWPTLDDHETLAFETALVDVLKRDRDPAVSLRNLQLEALCTWRAGGSSVIKDGVPKGSPVVWAAYAAIGFLSS